MIEIREIQTFSTSLYALNIPPGVELEQIAKSLEASGGSKTQKSNVGGWQSERQTFESIKYLQPFLENLLLLVNKIYKEFNVNKEAEIVDYWFNINRKNNYDWAHNHPHCFFSAIFHIKFLENSGNLVFERADPLRDWIDIHTVNEKNSNSLVFKPINNDLIIFPSYLKYKIEQNTTDSERITMTVNFR